MKYTLKIPIVVVAFNRDEALSRLLNNLSQAYYDDNSVDLIISIDKSYNEKVYKTAEDFTWIHGNKTVIKHEQNLGLRNHVLTCGDLVYNNDAIIMLEDDLCISKSFYRYSQQSVCFYQNDNNIAGISLYTYRITEFADFRPFIPLQDDSDTYFVQVPSSWGQIWTRYQWNSFREWYDNKIYLDICFNGIVPNLVLNWKESSWKKYFHMYIASKNKFFVYPRIALSTNMGNTGTHTKFASNSHQAILMGEFNRNYVFKQLEDTSSVKYDAFFENINIISFIKSNNDKISIDYYGLKANYLKDCLLLSTKKLNHKIIRSWDITLVPFELNILNDVPGDGLYLYDTSKVVVNKTKFKKTKIIKYEIPSITKEKAMIVFFVDYFNALKRRAMNILHF